MKYIIYQLPTDNDSCFMNWDYYSMKHNNIKGESFTSEHLKEWRNVYEGELTDLKVSDSEYYILSQLYRLLNINHPEDYKTRSLSVSDIVELEDGRRYFINSMGFVELKRA